MIALCEDCGGRFPRALDEGWKRLCLPCWRKAKGSPATASSAGADALDAARIRQLLQLVHPDKHGGSSLANDVTQWLLSLRRAAR